MKYTVINAFRLTNLIEDVNDLIKEGWEPLGGISGTVNSKTEDLYRHQYCQAMINNKRRKKPYHKFGNIQIRFDLCNGNYRFDYNGTYIQHAWNW